MDQKNKRMLEIAILVIVIAAGVALSAYVLMERGKVAKERQMSGELNTFRAGIALYTMVNKEKPATFKDLLSGTYEVGSSQLPYVVGVKGDAMKDGKPVDPFGNPYSYDARKGWVYSSTEGYRDW